MPNYVIIIPERYRRTERFGRSRSSKVIDFGTNRNRVCNFLLVLHGPILHRFGDITGFLCSWVTPPQFHPNFRGGPVASYRPCWGQPAHKPRAIRPYSKSWKINIRFSSPDCVFLGRFLDQFWCYIINLKFSVSEIAHKIVHKMTQRQQLQCWQLCRHWTGRLCWVDCWLLSLQFAAHGRGCKN